MAFTWGAGGQISSPEQAARKRSVAEALMAQSATPGSNWAEGLSDVAAALSGTILDNRVTEAETAGRERAGGLFADLAVNQDPNAIIAALTSPDAAWASPAQTSIASALLNSGLERQDPMYQLQRQKLEQEIAQMGQPQAVDPTAGMQNYDFLVGRGVDPAEAQTMAFGGNGPVVNVNTGDTDDFYKGLDTEAGKQVPLAIDAARVAQGNQIKLTQLETLIGNKGTAPQGAAGAFTLAASQLGIPLEGAGELQAAQALINQMVPGQRPPGSGTMSDMDLVLFKQSLPAIINQPNGNQRIIDTTKAINDYVIKQGEIATQLANRQISREKAAAMQAAIPNPLAGISSAVGTTPQAPGAATTGGYEILEVID